MVRIAICDDEKEAVTLHEEIIKDSLQSCGIGYEITTYTYSSNLLSDITEDGFFYDLLLLDIEMPDVTGMELAGKIKPFLPNIKVIFITSHMEYTIDAFELSIFRYVPKNDLEKRLKTAVADAVKLIELEAGKEYHYPDGRSDGEDDGKRVQSRPGHNRRGVKNHKKGCRLAWLGVEKRPHHRRAL